MVKSAILAVVTLMVAAGIVTCDVIYMHNKCMQDNFTYDCKPERR